MSVFKYVHSSERIPLSCLIFALDALLFFLSLKFAILRGATKPFVALTVDEIGQCGLEVSIPQVCWSVTLSGSGRAARIHFRRRMLYNDYKKTIGGPKMVKKKSVGRPRKVEKRKAERKQKANRRERLRQIGLVEVRVWALPELAVFLRRQSRETVARAEYDDVSQTLGEEIAEEYSTQLLAVLDSNQAEVNQEFERKRLAKLEARDASWREARKANSQDMRPSPPFFSFQGSRISG